MGKILTFIGVGAMFIDVARVFAEGFGKKTSAERSPDVGSLYVAGAIATYIGIPVWIVGAIKKKTITLELVKFNPLGSA